MITITAKKIRQLSIKYSRENELRSCILVINYIKSNLGIEIQINIDNKITR